jgi:hypothetical protein
MPYYQVSYKTEADQDGRVWRLGVFPSRDDALAFFNSTEARKEGIGPFTFMTGQPLRYYLIEQQKPPDGHEVMFALYNA